MFQALFEVLGIQLSNLKSLCSITDYKNNKYIYKNKRVVITSKILAWEIF